MFADGCDCMGRSMPFHISEQSFARSGCTPGATIESMDMESEGCEVLARRGSASMGRQRGIEASLSTGVGVGLCDVHWGGFV